MPEDPSGTRDDELLAVRCQLGEPDALADLIARWHDPLWMYVRRVTGDDDAAADAVQEIWLRVLRGLPRLRTPDRLRPWIFGIARRVLMDRWRTKYAAPPLADVAMDELADDVASPDVEIESARLQAVLDQLPVVEREVLVLFYLQELTLAELAGLLRLPVGTVKSRLHRARRLLRERLEAGGGGR